MIVKKIEAKQSYDFLLNKHYAQRIPSISYAFGLFVSRKMEGVLTIGKPASNSLCEGLCGKKYKTYVYELNRLCVNEGLKNNTLSWFVATCLKQLKSENIILVSYADEAMGHHGYIYQATNWIYTGKTKSRTDKYTPGGKHSRHYTDKYSHLRKYRSSKHRYVYFPNKTIKKICYPQLKYKIQPYPKGDNQRYKLGCKIKTKIVNKFTGEIFYE